MDSSDGIGLVEDNAKMKIEIRVPGTYEASVFTFSQLYTVDKVKTEIFRLMPTLNESMKFDYYLGLDEETAIKVEFTKLVKCHPSIAAKAAADEVIPLYLISRTPATVGTPETSKKLFRNKFSVGRTEEMPAIGSPHGAGKSSVAELGSCNSLVAKRASVFSAPNEESSPRGRPKATTLSCAVVKSALSQDEVTEIAASENRDSRIQRTNSFGERINQVKPRKQQTAETPLRTSAGSVTLDGKKQSSAGKTPSTPDAVRRSGDGDAARKGHRRTRSTGFIVASEIVKKAVSEVNGTPPSPASEKEDESGDDGGLFGLRKNRRLSASSQGGTGPRVRAAHQIFRSATQPQLGLKEEKPFPPRRVPLADEEEQVGNALVNVVEGYLIETGKRTLTPELVEATLYNPELNYTWYVDYFKGKEHENYIGSDPEFGTVVVSTVNETDDKSEKQLRVLVRTRFCDVTNLVPKADFGMNTFKKTSVRDIVRAACPSLAEKIPKVSYKQVKNPALHAELENFETKQVIKNYKIGVLYCKEGQSQEDEMFCNESGSEAFEAFLDFLGERVELNGWKQYRAGLDVNGGSTGTHSVYTQWNGTEIMFHVSTLLPFTPGDRQQIERKRHLGNDILMIVFKEGSGPPFSPNHITSEFNHVFAVISPEEREKEREKEKEKESSGGTPRRAKDETEDERNNRFRLKSITSAAAAAEGKAKAARISRSPPRRRVQDNAITKDKSSPRSPGSKGNSLTRSPTKKDREGGYRLAITRKDGVPSFGPYCDCEVFAKSQQFRDFLFYKLINGERAAYDAPIFNRKMVRVRGELLKHLEKTYA